MATDSRKFITADKAEAQGWSRRGNVYYRDQERLLPLYEAKMTHHYDHRFSTYDGATQEQLNKGTLPRLDDVAHSDPARGALSRYWVNEALVKEKLAGDPDRGKPDWPRDWMFGWRDIARSVDERTIITTVIPRVGIGDKFLLALARQQPIAGLQANLSAFVLDYAARQKATGASFKYFLMKQLPVLLPAVYENGAPWHSDVRLADWVIARVLELTFTAYDLEGFARDLGDEGSPFVWDRTRRALLRAELDAAYFHLYGVARDDVDYIMDTFKVVRERDEKTYGEFRTKRMILEVYDAMQVAIDTGMPYTTVVDPPPGHGARHPARDEALA